MKLVQHHTEQLGYDPINYLAIAQLEQLGLFKATQKQIDCMEKIIHISLKNSNSEFKKTLSKSELTGKPLLQLVENS